MFRHCVMFNWADDASDEAKAAVAAGLDELAKMDCVGSFKHGADAGLRDDNYDYVAVGDFDSIAAYRTYATDPGHLEMIANVIRPAISSRVAVQYHYDG